MMPTKCPTLKVGARVRVKQSGGTAGPTLYEVTQLLTGRPAACMIAEVAEDGTLYKAQPWLTSLLLPAVKL